MDEIYLSICNQRIPPTQADTFNVSGFWLQQQQQQHVVDRSTTDSATVCLNKNVKFYLHWMFQYRLSSMFN